MIKVFTSKNQFKFVRQYRDDLTIYKITAIKKGLIEYCRDDLNCKRGEACYTFKYFTELVKRGLIILLRGEKC